MRADRIPSQRDIERQVRLESEARRIAEHREVRIVVGPPRAYEFPGGLDLRLVEPASGLCLATCASWAEMRRLVLGLTPVYRQRLLERVSRCARHPQPPAQADEA